MLTGSAVPADTKEYSSYRYWKIWMAYYAPYEFMGIWRLYW